MPISDRVDTAVDRVGESFNLNGITYKGVFKLLDSGTMRTYLDDIEVLGLAKPAWFLTTKANVPLSIGDTITRGSVNYQVLKCIKVYVSGIAVACNAVLA
ncbi:MAG: hypothetical protein SNJ70_09520 [Armatimonadota bacterium]